MKFSSITLGLAFSALLLPACNPSPEVKTDQPTLTVTNPKLGDQEVPLDPQKIVAFDYGALDTIIALGAETKVAGLPKSNLPAILSNLASDKYANVGTLFEPNFELLYTLKPDLIIVSGRAAAKIDELRKIAPTISLEIENDHYYDSFRENTGLLGKILNKEAEANERLADIDAKLTGLAAKNANLQKTGLIALYTSGKVSVYGPKSRFGILHQNFGVQPADPNIVDSNSGQVVNFEYFKKIDPDYIFVIDRAQIVGEETLAKSFFDNEVMKSTKAYQNNGLVFLDTESWYTVTGGLQSMDKMIEEINRLAETSTKD